MFARINHHLFRARPEGLSPLEIIVLTTVVVLVACAAGYWLLHSSNELLPPAPGSPPAI